MLLLKSICKSTCSYCFFRKLTETEQFFEDVSKFYDAQLIDEAKKTNIKKRAEESKEDTKPGKEEGVDHMDIEESETTQHKAEIPFEKMDHNLK